MDRPRHRGVITESATDSSLGSRRVEACRSATDHRGMDAPFIPAEAGMYMSETAVSWRLAVQSLES